MSIGKSTMALETVTKDDAVKLLAHQNDVIMNHTSEKNYSRQYERKAYLNSKGHLCQH